MILVHVDIDLSYTGYHILFPFKRVIWPKIF